MRILLLNNHHRAQPGGAETVLLTTESLLREAGHEVGVFSLLEDGTPPGPYDNLLPRRHHLERSPFRLSRSLASTYSMGIRAQLRDVIHLFRPDIAHLHNVYAKLTWAVVDALYAEGVPMVCTVHDYRLVCPNGRLYSGGEPCSRCLSSSLAHAVRNSCLEDGRVASFVAAAELQMSRRKRHVERIQCFICPSNYAHSVMAAGGIATTRTKVLRNPVRAKMGTARAVDRPARFVFTGRFVEEKGVLDLVAAARSLPPHFRVQLWGEGRLERELRGAIAARDVPVEVYPPVPQQDVSSVLAGATAALVPSTWPENAPLAIVEAAAQGVPSIATDVGGIPELVESERDGLLVAPGDPQSLARSMVRLANDPLLAHRLGERARDRARTDHDPTRYVAELELIYANARAASSLVEASSRTETVSSPSIGGDS